MTEPVPHLRSAVQAFLERSGAAPARFGKEALGAPVLLQSADVRARPALRHRRRGARLQERGPAFRREIEAFVEVTCTKP